jgi:formylglycine-generating enzyme required for sulfatase activity
MNKLILLLITILLAGLIFWSCSDDSNPSSSETEKFIKVTSPNGSEDWSRASTRTIIWTDNINDDVRIDLYKGGVLFMNISDNVLSSGSFEWEIGAVMEAGSDFKIKITSTGDESVSDVSDQNFTVSYQTPPEGFAVIPGGTFIMGDHLSEGYSDELPLHSVYISDLYMGKYEITQKEWNDIMGSNPAAGYGVGDDYPVYNISWYSILKYCNLRSISEGLTPVYSINNYTHPANWGAVPTTDNSSWNAAVCNWSANGYRLPTEAEWEYAARGGLSGQRFPDGATISHSTNGATQANFYSSSESYNVSPTTGYHPDFNESSSPVGSFPPNDYGLYDMSGNMQEWCWDWYSTGYYSISPVNDPRGPDAGSFRLLRNGSWAHIEFCCRVSYRYSGSAFFNGYTSAGFRVARKL